MSKSIMQIDENICFLCGGYGANEWHHVFGGPYRKKSEHYGLKVRLHHDCHNEPPDGVHFNRDTRAWLEKQGQIYAMKKYGWSVKEFIEKFGKNHL